MLKIFSVRLVTTPQPRKSQLHLCRLAAHWAECVAGLCRGSYVAAMALEWKRSDISLLISLYREYPVMWNVKLKEYKDRNAKELAYRKIQKVFENHTENITLEQIKKKIHTLRSQYRREIKLITESQKSGMGADDVYNSQSFTHFLRFLLGLHFLTWAASSTMAASASSATELILPTD